MGHLDVLRELQREGWAATPRLERFVELLSLPTNDPGSVQKVLADLIFLGWRDQPDEAVYRRFFQRVFAAMVAKRPSGEVLPMIEAALSTVLDTLHARARSARLKPWLLTTSSQQGVASGLQEVQEVSARLGQRIAGSLARAWSRAQIAPEKF